MTDLINYCNQKDSQGGFINDMDHRQARVFRAYLIASLLGGNCQDVRFFDANGICFRTAMFN